jgi:hypothetical protein
MSISDSMGVYHCFSCGASGNLFTLIRSLANVTYPDDVLMSIDILSEVDAEVKECLVRHNLTSLASLVVHPTNNIPPTIYSTLNSNRNALASIQAIMLLLEKRKASMSTSTYLRSQAVATTTVNDISPLIKPPIVMNNPPPKSNSKESKLTSTDDIHAHHHRRRMVAALKYEDIITPSTLRFVLIHSYTR